MSDKKSCSAEFGYDEDDCDEDDAATDGPIKKVNRRAQCADPPSPRTRTRTHAHTHTLRERKQRRTLRPACLCRCHPLC